MSSIPVNVGIADIKVAKKPNQLRTVLGSCVAICLYDKTKKIAGIAHIMLPEQKSSEANPKKYADSALPILINEMETAGASAANLSAKLVGGAEVLKFSKFSSFSRIGKTNVDKLREILAKSGIPIVGEDTGGESGRNIVFNSSNGTIEISSLNGEHRSI